MNELARHIEILLLENDCVIVPGLGGFIAHYQPARYVGQENLYLPPVRTIGFNPQLVMNDGLLSQSYMQAYQTDFPDATRKIESHVDELKDTLYKEGKTAIHGVGVLHYTIRGCYEFHPNEEGVLSPTLYGLSSFSLHKIEELRSITPLTKEILPAKRTKERKVIHLNRQWLGNAVAVAAAVILFFFLSVPVENTYVDKGNYASLGTDGLFDAIRSQSLATTLVTLPAKPQQPQEKKTVQAKKASLPAKSLKPVSVRVEKVAAAPVALPNAEKTIEKAPKEVSKPALPKQAPAPVEEAKASGNRYFIIIASLPTSADAQQTLDSYKQKGYKEAAIVEGSGRYRISLCGFSDKTRAYRKLNELKQDDAFTNAWLLSTN